MSSIFYPSDQVLGLAGSSLASKDELSRRSIFKDRRGLRLCLTTLHCMASVNDGLRHWKEARHTSYTLNVHSPIHSLSYRHLLPAPTKPNQPPCDNRGRLECRAETPPFTFASLASRYAPCHSSNAQLDDEPPAPRRIDGYVSDDDVYNI